jgi:hypothetical protein
MMSIFPFNNFEHFLRSTVAILPDDQDQPESMFVAQRDGEVWRVDVDEDGILSALPLEFENEGKGD